MPTQTPTTWVEISHGALRNNIRILATHLGRRTMMVPVIKSNAYGHGLHEIARLLSQMKVRWMAVVSLEEALELRSQSIHANIIVLSFFHPDKIADAVKKNIRLTVYSYHAAQHISRIASQLRRNVRIHIKIDTGTSRLGFSPDEVFTVVPRIAQLPRIIIEGAFTHFADAESPDQIVTTRQTQIFQTIMQKISEKGITIPIQHAACSSAALLNPATRGSMARIGIALYGLWSVESPSLRRRLKRRIPLKPVLSWHTRIIQIKKLKQGSYIGYGLSYKVRRPSTIAVLPIGYWDGYDRSLSNLASVMINGKRCPVRGRVCMNLTMVDITGAGRIRVGDTATLIGYNAHTSVSADDLARWAGTINYEIVTRINPQIPRIITR